MQDYGSGEIVLHFVNNDGLCTGYDYEIINKLLRYIKVPVTFLGGLKDIDEITKKIQKVDNSQLKNSLNKFLKAYNERNK